MIDGDGWKVWDSCRGFLGGGGGIGFGVVGFAGEAALNGGGGGRIGMVDF